MSSRVSDTNKTTSSVSTSSTKSDVDRSRRSKSRERSTSKGRSKSSSKSPSRRKKSEKIDTHKVYTKKELNDSTAAAAKYTIKVTTRRMTTRSQTAKVDSNNDKVKTNENLKQDTSISDDVVKSESPSGYSLRQRTTVIKTVETTTARGDNESSSNKNFKYSGYLKYKNSNIYAIIALTIIALLIFLYINHVTIKNKDDSIYTRLIKTFEQFVKRWKS